MRSLVLLMLLAVMLAGCAAIETVEPGDEPSPEEQEAKQVPDPEPPREPVEDARRTTAQDLAPAAANLLSTAQGFMMGGDPGRALSVIQRAHRISPNAPEVYYHYAQAHQLREDWPRAEQFARRGIALAGDNEDKARAGWTLLAEIRDEAGDAEGAAEAADKAAR